MDSSRPVALEPNARACYVDEPKPRPKRPWTPAADKQLSKAEQKRRRKRERRVSQHLLTGSLPARVETPADRPWVKLLSPDELRHE